MADTPSKGSGTVHLHLRLRTADAELLRRIAEERDQTMSAVVRWLLRQHYRSQVLGQEPTRQLDKAG
jgi:hypothetical protein